VRRSVPATIVVLVGLLLLVNFVVINPLVAGVAREVLRLVVVVAAAAAVAGALALVLRHGSDLWRGRGDRAGSLVLLIGLAGMLVAGFYPGSAGAADPAVRWLVAALLAPIVAALFALLFVFTLVAMQRGMLLRSRQVTVMLAAAAAVVVLLLPLGGPAGAWLATAASWTTAVPIGGVFRGLLIGVAIATAIHAARIVLAVDGADD
jgi:peptidoglycan/LPS O-acetylase OafA/YrhL